jgi:hypothetical protein
MMQQFVIRAQTAAESLATGQVQTAPDVLWVWSALRLRDVSQVPGVPQNTAIGEARSWVFSRAANSRAIVVQCFVLLPRDADSALLAERLQNASEHFATIIKSISVEPLTK